MKTNLILGWLTALAAFAALSQAAAQPITLTGTSYFQDFDLLETALPGEFYLYTAATATSPGNLYAWANINQYASSNTWRTTSMRFANQASTSCWGTNFIGDESAAIQQTATNRALAVRQTSATGVDPGTAFVLKIADTVGKGNFSLNVDLMNLDPTSPRVTTWTIDYGVGAFPSAFLPLAWFTNSAQVFYTSNITFSFGSALDQKVETVWIRIVALQPSTGSGSRKTFGIDNFRLTWEEVTGDRPVAITQQPASATNNAGRTASFTVGATGTNPTYQWRKNGVDLYDDGFHIQGATTPTLRLINVFEADEGAYTVYVANSLNNKTSDPATLKVIDPVVSSGPTPAAKTVMPGDLGNFFAVVWGTDPVSFQWRFNGADLPGETSYIPTGTNYSSTLFVTNAQAADAGDYTLYVSSSFGSFTSSVATLSVLDAPTNLLARWDFNNTNDVVTAPAPSIGTGTAATVGGTNAYFPAGTFSDPAIVLGYTNAGWNTQYYPTNAAQSNKQVGVEFKVSTAGQKNIMVAWEERHSNTASKYQRFQYSTDGGQTFVDGPVIPYNVTDNSFVLNSVDLSSVAAVNNNPNFAFRIVVEWQSTATGSGADTYVGTTSYNGGQSGGTIRYDLVTVFGNTAPATPDPIPLAIENYTDHVVLRWTDPAFSLATSPTIDGAFSKIPGATSPHTNSVSADAQFFRLVFP